MRLALVLGRANPDAMLAEMPARVYLDWLAFAQEEQWWTYDERDTYRAALIAYTIAATTPRKKGSRRPKFEDFVLKFERTKKKPQTGQQMFDGLKALTVMTGGTFTDTRK